MHTIAPTDSNWFNYLKNNALNSFVNFWTPTPWNVKQMNFGNKLYFLLKSPIRQIAGFGEFYEYKNLKASQAWEVFGHRNGYDSFDALKLILQDYVNKNSHLNLNAQNVSNHIIGCIVLENCQFWEEVEYKGLIENEIDFANSIVRFKYYKSDPLNNLVDNLQSNFALISGQPKKKKTYESTNREGQGKFKGQLLKAYNNRCCISGEDIPEILEAAHIQPYINQQSNHVQNGLLIRVDLHRLYDNNLIYIDEDFVIKVSSVLKKTNYYQYNQQMITLPKLIKDHPSTQALITRKDDFRE